MNLQQQTATQAMKQSPGQHLSLKQQKLRNVNREWQLGSGAREISFERDLPAGSQANHPA